MQFEERDITQNPEFIAELRELGSMSTPTTVVGDEVLVGFDRAKITALLDL